MQTIAPECGPTQPLVSRVCRVIRNCIDGVGEGDEDRDPAADRKESTGRSGFHVGPRKARSIASPERELPFIRSIQRLANWQGFSVEIVVSSAEKMPSANNLYQVCGTMRQRCELIQERLLADYPELANA